MTGASSSGPWRERLLRLLRVPSAPTPPPGDEQAVRTFRAARNYYRYRVARWTVQQASALVGIVIGYMFLRAITGRAGFGIPFINIIEPLLIAGFVAQLPFSFAILRLDFELRWYMLSDRCLRIREGILTVREQTVTFANVQNISISQNPLERLFRVSNVSVRTAGGGGSAGQGAHGAGSSQQRGSHEAVFEGVADGAAIRDLIRARVRQHRDAGLGDPDDAGLRGVDDAGQVTPAAAEAAAPGPTVLDAARAALAEARALRLALAGD